VSQLNKLAVLTLGLLMALACDDEPASSPVQPTAILTVEAGTEAGWTQRSPLPTPRSEVASAVLDGKIYVIAGFSANGQSTAVNEVYDTATDRWERKASLPEGRDHAMAAALGGKVYVFGGGLGDATRTTFAYDPGRDTWTRMADMPFRRTAGGAAAYAGNDIIVVGGTGDSPEMTMFYTPSSDRWRMGPPLSAPREHLGVTATGDAVYVVGGRWQDVLKDTNEVLPVGNNVVWRSLASLPTARGGTAAGTINGRVHVAGGEAFGPTRTFEEVEVYDPRTDRWTRLPGLPTPRHGLAVQGVGDVLYVIGGGPVAGLSVSPQNEAFRTR
jgi:N-acetylneuraminic acid mutarotase